MILNNGEKTDQLGMAGLNEQQGGELCEVFVFLPHTAQTPLPTPALPTPPRKKKRKSKLRNKTKQNKTFR